MNQNDKVVMTFPITVNERPSEIRVPVNITTPPVNVNISAVQGAQGIPGINGTNGTNGGNGTNGTNGRDAPWIPGPEAEPAEDGVMMVVNSPRGFPGEWFQEFLSADVPLNSQGVEFPVLSTPTFGAAGEAWFITAIALVVDTAGPAAIGAAIQNNASGFDLTYEETTTEENGFFACIPLSLILQMTAPISLTLTATDFSGTTGFAKAKGSSPTTNLSTTIMGFRIS